MRKVTAFLMIFAMVIGLSTASYASDWDKAGKALAIIEGARILTGGRVDIIGNFTGINQNNRSRSRQRGYSDRYARNYSCPPQQTWVPNLVWRKKYIPEHEEYRNNYGRIIVGSHYIRYQAEDGGHWE